MFRQVSSSKVACALICAAVLLAGVSAQRTTSIHTDSTCTIDKMLSYDHEYRTGGNGNGGVCVDVACTETQPGIFTKITCGPLTFAQLGVVTDRWSDDPAFGSTVCNGTKERTSWVKTGVCIPFGVRSSSTSYRYSVSGNDGDSTIVTELCANADCTACTKTELYKAAKNKCNAGGNTSYYGVSSATKSAIATVFSGVAVLLACVLLM